MTTLRIGRFAAAATLGLFAGSLQAHAQSLFAGDASAHFTAAQAALGKVQYDNSCEVCHGPDLDHGNYGPALTGAEFVSKWKDRTAEALFSNIKTTMPPSTPDYLGDEAYANMVAYIMSANGGTAGSEAFAPGALAKAQAPARRAGPPASTQDDIYMAAMADRKALLGKMTPVTDAMLKDPPTGDWLFWRGSYNQISYSPLKQIDKSNVARLNVGWTLSLPPSGNEITPLEHDGVLFIDSGNTVMAVNATDGDVLWRHVRALPKSLEKGSTTRMKSIAIYQDKIFAPTADGHMVALDAKTGKLLWDTEIITPEQVYESGHHGTGYHMSGAPLVAHGKVIMGVSLGITTAGGDFIVGLDPDTGKEMWRFHTIARPGQPGGDSWNGAPVDQRYGGGVWTSGSYDPDLNLVYFGTGNTYDMGTLLLPHEQKGKSNDALYTDTTLALNPDTGKLVWYYQHMNRDVWDLDWVFEQSLVTLPVDGKPKNLLVTGGKIAIFDAVDRATGKYEFSKDLGLQNLVARIDPKTGKKIIKPEFANPVPGKPYFLCDAFRNWPTTSYDPESHILYVPLNEHCGNYIWEPRDAAATAAGGQDYGGGGGGGPHPDAIPKDGKYGRIEAINLETKQVVWIHRQRASISSSMLSTAGGLAFEGASDSYFRAFDAATGEVLWKLRLNDVPRTSPISYSVDGVQYIALVSGLGAPPSDAGRSSTPEIYSPPGGETLWVFKLPGAVGNAQH